MGTPGVVKQGEKEREIGCACVSTQEGGANYDGLGALLTTTFPLFQNHTLARDLPHPCWVHIKVRLKGETWAEGEGKSG